MSNAFQLSSAQNGTDYSHDSFAIFAVLKFFAKLLKRRVQKVIPLGYSWQLFA
jgi:hypothetical protein